LYTLKDDDHSFGGLSFLSFYKLYMQTEDPTEYLFAKTYLDGWQHWELLCRAPWFKPYLVRFRTELDLGIRAAALQRIKGESKSNSKNAFTANRFLLEKGWISKESTRGRPSNDEITRKAQEVLQDSQILDEDFQRIITLPRMKVPLNA
jgi:hypothetical protein